MVLDLEVEPEQLVEPLMLGDSGQPLVEEELQADVVSADGEAPSPEVGAPVSNGLHEADQLALVGCQLAMASCKGLAEEGQGTLSLVKDRAEACAAGVAIHDKPTLEV